MSTSNHKVTLAVESLLESTLEQEVRVVSFDPVSGGCINQAFRVMTNVECFFIKTNPSAIAHDMFRAESIGLKRLAEFASTPRVVAQGQVESLHFLVLEWLESKSTTVEFWERFGHQLAQLHRDSAKSEFGLPHDNFIGVSPQRNSTSHNWVEFWVQQRMTPQLELAARNGAMANVTSKRLESFLKRVETVLIQPEFASLLHGDLWNGNFIPSESGKPYLIDPAVYFGHSEAEFGIIDLFGGFHDRFFLAYHEVLPKLEGFSDRLELYKLYHLLNHLNLFGSSYVGDCLQTIRRFS